MAKKDKLFYKGIFLGFIGGFLGNLFASALYDYLIAGANQWIKLAAFG